MKITICGLAGTGTSTAGKKLSAVLNYEFISSGGIFRSKAAELGLDLNAFEDLCKQDEAYDRAVDDEIATLGKTKNDIVVESRLAWYFIPDSYKVLFTCDEGTRIKRVAGRDNLTLSGAKEKTRHREDAIRERFKTYYDIDQFDDPARFDLVVDTTATSIGKTVQTIVDALPST